MKYLLWSLVALVVLVGLMMVIGYLLPVAHTASRDALIAAPAPDVFATISDVARYPDWWSDIVEATMPRCRARAAARIGVTSSRCARMLDSCGVSGAPLDRRW